MRTVRIFDSPEQVTRFAAEFLRKELTEHTGAFRYSIALSGGSTPRLLYRAFSRMANAGALCRERADFFFSDERAVGPDADDSNYRTAHLGLFQPLGIGERIVQRMKGEVPDLAAEAARYEELIKGRLGHQGQEIPSFDLIFLGMGPDGHTASLFPDFDFSSTGNALVVAPFVTSIESHRLTFTMNLINQSRKVMLMVTGPEKREAVTKALSSGIKHDILPAGRVDADHTLWLLDRDAAGQLDPNEIGGIEIEC